MHKDTFLYLKRYRRIESLRAQGKEAAPECQSLILAQNRSEKSLALALEECFAALEHVKATLKLYQRGQEYDAIYRMIDEVLP